MVRKTTRYLRRVPLAATSRGLLFFQASGENAGGNGDCRGETVDDVGGRGRRHAGRDFGGKVGHESPARTSNCASSPPQTGEICEREAFAEMEWPARAFLRVSLADSSELVNTVRSSPFPRNPEKLLCPLAFLFPLLNHPRRGFRDSRADRLGSLARKAIRHAFQSGGTCVNINNG